MYPSVGCDVCGRFAEIAAGNYTDETVIPGYPVEFFPGGRGDSHAYDEMTFDAGLSLLCR